MAPSWIWRATRQSSARSPWRRRNWQYRNESFALHGVAAPFLIWPATLKPANTTDCLSICTVTGIEWRRISPRINRNSRLESVKSSSSCRSPNNRVTCSADPLLRQIISICLSSHESWSGIRTGRRLTCSVAGSRNSYQGMQFHSVLHLADKDQYAFDTCAPDGIVWVTLRKCNHVEFRVKNQLQNTLKARPILSTVSFETLASHFKMVQIRATNGAIVTGLNTPCSGRYLKFKSLKMSKWSRFNIKSFNRSISPS